MTDLRTPEEAAAFARNHTDPVYFPVAPALLSEIVGAEWRRSDGVLVTVKSISLFLDERTGRIEATPILTARMPE